eukprot:gene28167-31330_t
MNHIVARSRWLLALLLCAAPLAGCSREAAPDDDAALYQSNAATLTPGVQPVRVGEGGPAFRACASVGQVVNLSPAGERYLAVRTAPFAEADEVVRLGDGAKMYLCSRSLDQRWQGVVVPPADAPTSDCGVTTSLAGPRAYAGPCKSGWVLSGFYRVRHLPIGTNTAVLNFGFASRDRIGHRRGCTDTTDGGPMALDPETFDALIDTVRRFVAERLRPLEAAVEEADAIPADVVQDMREMGLFGLSIDEAYGGL